MPAYASVHCGDLPLNRPAVVVFRTPARVRTTPIATRASRRAPGVHHPATSLCADHQLQRAPSEVCDMRKNFWKATLAVAAASVVSLGAQTPTTSGSQSGSSSRSGSSGSITVTGCLQGGSGSSSATGTSGTSSTAGSSTAAGSSSGGSFMLTNAMMSSGSGSSASGSSGTSGTSGTTGSGTSSTGSGTSGSGTSSTGSGTSG